MLGNGWSTCWGCVERQVNGRVIEGVKDFLESAWRERMKMIERQGPLRDREGDGEQV